MAKKSSITLSVEEAVELFKPFSEFKRRHPDALMLMHYGFHYVLLAQDAQHTMRILDIKPNVIDLPDANGLKYLSFAAGELETLLIKLVRSGMRVAVCDNNPDPRETTKLVKRGIN